MIILTEAIVQYYTDKNTSLELNSEGMCVNRTISKETRSRRWRDTFAQGEEEMGEDIERVLSRVREE